MDIRSISDIVGVADNLVRDTGLPGSGLRWWFRGVDSHEYDLWPTAVRNYSPREEQWFYNEFYCRAGTRYSNCPAPEDIASWLSLMQHYRLPTRLLDWSFSPLVAAYFATLEPTGPRVAEYACIWALAPSVLNEDQGLKPLLYPLNALTLRPLLEPAKRGRDTEDMIAAAMAVETDPRMQMQQGAFTVHASRTPLNRHSNAAKWLRKFLIPMESVPSLRWELKLLGYRADYLFPDLESLAAELRSFIPPNT